MLIFIGDIDEEWYNVGVPMHQLQQKVEARRHTLTDQALMPRCAAADQPVQGFHNHLTLCFVTLRQDKQTSASDARCQRTCFYLALCFAKLMAIRQRLAENILPG